MKAFQLYSHVALTIVTLVTSTGCVSWLWPIGFVFCNDCITSKFIDKFMFRFTSQFH